jgi:hypothetical protein
MDSVVSSVTTKVKGVAVTNTSKLGFRIWDVADYVIPAQVCLSQWLPSGLCFLFIDFAHVINDSWTEF